MIDERTLYLAAETLQAIPYYPTSGIAQAAIMREIAKFVDQPDRLRWLVETAVGNMREWTGVPELRGLYCTRYKPADGNEADCTTPGYTANECEAAHAREFASGESLALPVEIRNAEPKKIPP